MPIDGERNGWIALLRFMARESVDLVAFEVTYYAERELPQADSPLATMLRREYEADGTLEQRIIDARERDFHEWVQERASRSAPTDVPPGGLTMRKLRGIRVGDFQTAARRYLGHGASTGGFLGDQWTTEAVRRPGPRGKSDRHYAELAAAYVRHLEETPKPIASLSRELGFSTMTIRNQVREARRRGLLTQTSRGVAGGGLTDRAIELINEEAPS